MQATSVDVPVDSPTVNSSYRWWLVLWREQPAFALSLLYLLLGVAGSYYYAELFAGFGINIFYYAEVQDFLLVIFREPLVPGLTLLVALLLYLVYRVDGMLDSRFPRYKQISGFFQRWLENDPYFGKRGRSEMIWEALVLLIVVLFVRFITPFCVRYTMHEIKRTSHRQVIIYVSGKSGPGAAESMRLIGTTGRFFFLYEPNSRQTHIIPVESTTRIVTGGDQTSVINRDGPDPPTSSE